MKTKNYYNKLNLLFLNYKYAELKGAFLLITCDYWGRTEYF